VMAVLELALESARQGRELAFAVPDAA